MPCKNRPTLVLVVGAKLVLTFGREIFTVLLMHAKRNLSVSPGETVVQDAEMSLLLRGMIQAAKILRMLPTYTACVYELEYRPSSGVGLRIFARCEAESSPALCTRPTR